MANALFTATQRRAQGKVSLGPRDIDLLFISRGLQDEDVDLALTELSGRLGCGFSFLIMEPDDLAEEARANRWLLNTILRQPRIWVIGDEGRLAWFSDGP